jgi:DNA (cytosine-5)-methyltransferase 1
MGRPSRIINEDITGFFNLPGVKVLDICCCSGVSAEGIKQCNTNVLGVDIVKPSYYPGTFMQADALTLTVDFVKKFDFVWASPPCQLFSDGTSVARKQGKEYPNLIPQISELLTLSGVPAAMENVCESGIRPDFMLCGSMFGLPLQRHRHIQCFNWVPVYKRLYCNHDAYKGRLLTIAGSFKGSVHDAAEAMQCYPGRLRSEIKEGVPPAYSKFVFECWFNTFIL